MPLTEDPREAADIIAFTGDRSGPAVIRYDVPLPGRHKGKRVIRLDLGLAPSDFKRSAAVVSSSIQALEWKETAAGGWAYNADKANDIFFNAVRDAGFGVGGGGTSMQAALGKVEAAARAESRKPDGTLQVPTLPALSGPLVQLASMLLDLYTKFVDALSRGDLTLPVKRWDGQIEQVTTSALDAQGGKTSLADLFLVETYGISSFLGHYGLGRTVRTFSLLPGEETKISIKTWRSDTVKATEASTIVDSFTTEAADRFTTSVQHETTDKMNRLNKMNWHAEAEVKARWGWGDAKVTGGGGGEFQQDREQFAKQVGSALREHTSQASSNRSNTVTSSSERTTATGEEITTERTIRNINLRRVLNFAFRELNQEYITRIHLMDVKVAFTTGGTNSWREVPISGLRGLLEDVLAAGKVDSTAQRILDVAGTVMDLSDVPVTTLQRLNLNSNGSYAVAGSTTRNSASGQFDPPPANRAFLYRFAPGPLGQAPSDPHLVEGVLLKELTITMRTESVVVEAVLGQADALDPYAMRAQLDEAEARTLANRRAEIGITTLEAIADPAARAEAFAKMFNPVGKP